MKVYVVYVLGYTGSNELEILGVYKDIESAEDRYFREIKENIENYDYDFDKECNDIVSELGRVTRLFKGGYQENWDNYLEIYLSVEEVQ